MGSELMIRSASLAPSEGEDPALGRTDDEASVGDGERQRLAFDGVRPPLLSGLGVVRHDLAISAGEQRLACQDKRVSMRCFDLPRDARGQVGLEPVDARTELEEASAQRGLLAPAAKLKGDKVITCAELEP